MNALINQNPTTAIVMHLVLTQLVHLNAHVYPALLVMALCVKILMNANQYLTQMKFYAITLAHARIQLVITVVSASMDTLIAQIQIHV